MYRDRWIETTDDGIGVRGYYFPWGTKRVAFVFDLGRPVQPFLTPDDPDAFEREVGAHAKVEAGSGPVGLWA